MSVQFEYCYQCYEPTGKAGETEDSLYTDNARLGPYCEDCWGDVEYWRKYTDDISVELEKYKTRMRTD